MPRLFLNPAATPDKQCELKDEQSGATIATGYLIFDIVPSNVGDRLSGPSFITTTVKAPAPTTVAPGEGFA